MSSKWFVLLAASIAIAGSPSGSPAYAASYQFPECDLNDVRLQFPEQPALPYEADGRTYTGVFIEKNANDFTQHYLDNLTDLGTYATSGEAGWHAWSTQWYNRNTTDFGLQSWELYVNPDLFLTNDEIWDEWGYPKFDTMGFVCGYGDLVTDFNATYTPPAEPPQDYVFCSDAVDADGSCVVDNWKNILRTFSAAMIFVGVLFGFLTILYKHVRY